MYAPEIELYLKREQTRTISKVAYQWLTTPHRKEKRIQLNLNHYLPTRIACFTYTETNHIRLKKLQR